MCSLYWLMICSMMPKINADLVHMKGTQLVSSQMAVRNGKMSLFDCAKACYQATQTRCYIMQYDAATRVCRFTSQRANLVFENIPLKSGVQMYSYARTCATAPTLSLTMRYMARWSNGATDHRFLKNEDFPMPKASGLGFLGAIIQIPMQSEKVGWCYVEATGFGVFCSLVAFGSSDGGRSLTRDTGSKKFVRYGYCAAKQGICKAFTPVYDWVNAQYSNHIYMANSAQPAKNGPQYVKKPPTPLCYFWQDEQCGGNDNTKKSFKFKVF